MPVVFRVYMDEPAEQLDEVYCDEPADPFGKFLEQRAVAVQGGEAGAAALQAFGTGREIRRVDFEDGRLQKVADEWDEEITGGDAQRLEKRVQQSTRRVQLTAFVKRRLAAGETIESLAVYAAKHDQETANLIRTIGAEL